MASRRGMRVMVVVPPFAEREQRNPPVIGRVIARLEAARAPDVRRRIHQPGSVQADGGPEEDAPEHIGPAAERQQDQADDDIRDPVPGGQPDVELVPAQVGRIARQHGRVPVQPLTHENPAHVGPPATLARRVRVALAVRLLVVNAMRGDPEDRPTLERERAADRQEILDPQIGLVGAVREQAVVGHADAEAPGDPPQERRGKHCADVDVEQRDHREDMKGRHRDRSDPVHALLISAPV